MLARDAYAETLSLGEWLGARARNIIIPLRTIMSNLTSHYDHLSLAAYLMALNGARRIEHNIIPRSSSGGLQAS